VVRVPARRRCVAVVRRVGPGRAVAAQLARVLARGPVKVVASLLPERQSEPVAAEAARLAGEIALPFQPLPLAADLQEQELALAQLERAAPRVGLVTALSMAPDAAAAVA
jgi:hypothetical protein